MALGPSRILCKSKQELGWPHSDLHPGSTILSLHLLWIHMVALMWM